MSRFFDRASRPYVIAEIGINHDGDFDVARRSIEAAARSGADAVKFQTFRASEFMAARDVEYAYVVDGAEVTESMFEMFERLELPVAWHRALQEHARVCGVDFSSSVADPESANLLASLAVPWIKLASEDLINLALVGHVAGLGIPLILSTGMADVDEIERALARLRENGNPRVALLHCVSIYPTPDGEANLRRMVTLRERYGLPVGYSDHTRGCSAAIAATALGAEIIEKHFTLDCGRAGPDHALSADPAELETLVGETTRVARQLGRERIAPAEGEAESRRVFRRGAVAARNLGSGVVITRADVVFRRPATGAAPHELERLIGRRLLRSIDENQPLALEDVR